MGIWKKEVVKIDGDYFLYVENQDDYTGQITNGIRRIKYKNGEYTCLNMGSRLNLTDEVNRLKIREDEIQKALKWYHDTKF